MRVAIIVPALNEAEGIGATLRSLECFRATGCPIVVADGGSIDATATIALPLCDCLVQSTRGRAQQMNAGTAAVDDGIDAYLFLHADSRLPDHAIEAVSAALSSSGRSWGRFDVTIQGQSRWLPVVAALMNLRSRLTGIATGDQAMFMTRAAFDAAGGFPDQPLMEDIGMSRRLRSEGVV